MPFKNAKCRHALSLTESIAEYAEHVLQDLETFSAHVVPNF